MTPTIEQSVRFNATARRLYELYINPRLHSAFTGAKVTISAKPGSRFSAFNGMLSGQMSGVIPGKLIVQHWRSVHFKKSDPDSVLVLYFVQDGKHGRIDLAHVNVPEHDHAGVTNGWKKHYWGPIKRYLSKTHPKQ
jgi:activator of HSP90 ATPase